MTILYYHTKSVAKKLRTLLENLVKKQGAQLLSEREIADRPDQFEWAIVHKTDKGDPEINEKYYGLQLVVYLNQDATDCTREQVSRSTKRTAWLARTQTVIDDFDALCQYVEQHASAAAITDLDPRGWIRPRHTLIALDVLCQGYRVAHGDSELHGFDGIPAARVQSATRNRKLTECHKWWFRGLGVDSITKIRDQLHDEKVPESTIGEIIKAFDDEVFMLASIQSLHRFVKSML